jgi:mono/diheme cytochrome c family protein
MKRSAAGISALTLLSGIAVFSAMTAGSAAPLQVAQADPDPALMAALMDEGQAIFEHNCATCHGDEGQGRVGPMLAGNEVLSSSRAVVSQILAGNTDHGMPPFADTLDNHEIAAVATFIRNSWGNAYGITVEASVEALRP